MWVYLQNGNVFTVGFFDPGGSWHATDDFKDETEAAARVHYLNGGDLR